MKIWLVFSRLVQINLERCTDWSWHDEELGGAGSEIQKQSGRSSPQSFEQKMRRYNPPLEDDMSSIML
jgi:hypothetical protein